MRVEPARHFGHAALPSNGCSRVPGAAASRPRSWRSLLRPQKSDALSNLFGRPENRARQVDELQALVSKWQRQGQPACSSPTARPLWRLPGVSPEPAEMVIATPQAGGKFAVAGRLIVEPR